MRTSKILKWSVPADGGQHWIGGGPVVLVDATRFDAVLVWTREDFLDTTKVIPDRLVTVVGTGYEFSSYAASIGSTVASREPLLVWHVIELP